jgi:PhzF family phenazine biosynthesis protein
VTTEVLRYAAFTVDGRGGNPAGVVLDARGLDAAEMQTIAADVGYSETAFLVARADEPNVYDVRYFVSAVQPIRLKVSAATSGRMRRVWLTS